MCPAISLRGNDLVLTNSVLVVTFQDLCTVNNGNLSISQCGHPQTDGFLHGSHAVLVSIFFLWLGFSLFGLFGEICLCLQDLIEGGRGQCSLVDLLFLLLIKNRVSSPSGLFTIVSELIAGTLHPQQFAEFQVESHLYGFHCPSKF